MTKNKIYLALALSLLLHLSQYIVIKKIPLPQMGTAKDDIIEFYPIEKTENPPKPENSKPLVTTPQKTPTLIDNDKPADFFSEEKNRVTEQTRVERLGLNQNKSNNSLLQKAKTPSQKIDSGLEFDQTLQGSVRQNQPSQYQHQLPQDIALGDVTNLNTDAHIYGSFYNRVADAFYIRWVENLEKTWNRLSLETKQKLSGYVWKTELEIVLKENGEVQQVLIMKPSGFTPFDTSGTQAFYSARMFPNPPRAKVEADGTIRLKYRIAVHVR